MTRRSSSGDHCNDRDDVDDKMTRMIEMVFALTVMTMIIEISRIIVMVMVMTLMTSVIEMMEMVMVLMVIPSGKSVSLLTGLLFSGHYDHIIGRSVNHHFWVLLNLKA